MSVSGIIASEPGVAQTLCCKDKFLKVFQPPWPTISLLWLHLQFLLSLSSSPFYLPSDSTIPRLSSLISSRLLLLWPLSQLSLFTGQLLPSCRRRRRSCYRLLTRYSRRCTRPFRHFHSSTCQQLTCLHSAVRRLAALLFLQPSPDGCPSTCTASAAPALLLLSSCHRLRMFNLKSVRVDHFRKAFYLT